MRDHLQVSILLPRLCTCQFFAEACNISPLPPRGRFYRRSVRPSVPGLEEMGTEVGAGVWLCIQTFTPFRNCTVCAHTVISATTLFVWRVLKGEPEANLASLA